MSKLEVGKSNRISTESFTKDLIIETGNTTSNIILKSNNVNISGTLIINGENILAIPSQLNNNGKYLKTDGSGLIWSNINNENIQYDSISLDNSDISININGNNININNTGIYGNIYTNDISLLNTALNGNLYTENAILNNTEIFNNLTILNGKVGIRTSDPSENLHVIGNIKGSGNLLIDGYISGYNINILENSFNALESNFNNLDASFTLLNNSEINLTNYKDASFNNVDISGILLVNNNNVILRSDLDASINYINFILSNFISGDFIMQNEFDSSFSNLESLVSDVSIILYNIIDIVNTLDVSYVSDISFEEVTTQLNNLNVSLNDYAKLNDLSAYVLDASLNDYAKLNDLSAYVLDASLNDYAKLNDLSAYVLDASLNDYAKFNDLSAYVLDASLNDYAKLNDLFNELSGDFITREQLDASLSSTLQVDGTSILQTLNAGATDISSTLQVNGATTLNSTLQVDGVATFSGSNKGVVIENDISLNRDLYIGRTIYGPSSMTIDPASHGDDTGTLIIKGGLQVLGTTTTINSTIVDISDKAIVLASNAASSSQADGAGFEISGANVSFLYNSSPEQFVSSIDISAGTFIGALTGNASTASTLETSRTISLGGDLSGSVDFNGGVDVTLNATIQPNSVALETDTTGNYVASITNGNYLTGGDTGSEGANLTLAVDASSSNVASKIVARDANGDFAAGTITASLTGNVSGNISSSGDSSFNRLRPYISNSFIGFSSAILPIDNGSTLSVTANTYTIKSFNDLSSNLTTTANIWHDLSASYIIEPSLNSQHSYVYLQFKINYICSNEADQTISFKICNESGTTVFQDLSMGTSMGVTSRGVYNGTYIDTSPGSTNPKYYLNYLIGSDTDIDVSAGVLGADDGNYNFIMAQELYRPSS